MRLLAYLFVFALLLPLGLASTHNQGGGLPGVSDRVALVEEVLFVREVDRITGMPSMFVGGTEYEPGDPGKTFVQIDINGLPVNNASCFASAWFPNTTTFFIDQVMVSLDRGIYFYDFLVPDQIGVFPVSVSCDFLVKTDITFAENLVIIGGSKVVGEIGDTYLLDGNVVTFSETTGGQRGFDISMDFLNVDLTSNTSTVVVDAFVQRAENGNDGNNDLVNYWLFNWSSADYVFMAAPYDYLENFRRKTTMISASSEDFVSNNGTVRLLINDTVRSGGDNKDTLIDFDLLRLITINPIENVSVQVVRGGGELHVRNSTNIIVEVIDAPVTFDVEGLLIAMAALLLIGLFFIQIPVFWVLTGITYVITGLYVLPERGFFVGIIIMGIGGVFVARGVFSMTTEGFK